MGSTAPMLAWPGTGRQLVCPAPLFRRFDGCCRDFNLANAGDVEVTSAFPHTVTISHANPTLASLTVGGNVVVAGTTLSVSGAMTVTERWDATTQMGLDTLVPAGSLTLSGNMNVTGAFRNWGGTMNQSGGVVALDGGKPLPCQSRAT